MTEAKDVQFEVKHNLLRVNINGSYEGPENAYESTRGGWILNQGRAEAEVEYVIGVSKDGGKDYKVVSIYKPDKWYPDPGGDVRRLRFDADDQAVSQSVKEIYLNKLVPPKYLGRAPAIYIPHEG